MNLKGCVAAGVGLIVVAFASNGHLAAEGPKVVGVTDTDRIVPLIIVKAGESKELSLATWCTVGLSRAGGLGVSEMKDGKPGSTKSDESGLTVSIPDSTEAEKISRSPEYAELKKKELNVFFVKASAAKNAKSGLYDFHIFDATCSGHCHTDFRVLVLPQ